MSTTSPILEQIKNEDSYLWDRKLGHGSMNTISKLLSLGLVIRLPKLNIENDKFCDACAKGKHRGSSFKSKMNVTTIRALQLLHIDLFGPTRTTSLSGKNYGLVIADDYTRFSFLLTKMKAELNSYALNNGKENLGKFDAKSDERIFLEYSLSSNAYRTFNKRTLIVEEFIHVLFDDTNPTRKENYDDNIGILQEQFEGLVRKEVDESKIIGDPNKGVRTRAKVQNVLCQIWELVPTSNDYPFAGKMNYSLGLQITQREDGTFISPAKYTKNMLKKFGMEGTRTYYPPMSTTAMLDKEEKIGKVHLVHANS
ncbi:Uncharacterized protein TCM_032910 [Theobroma cacao]|uniref:Uncharacterized protein n=1 Tax=Theobroma cacao TaxID=3641 RepID=A0A061F9E0_THECC|nr:Uncharacterized protein TCM_032910 [Theobroma cacao]